MSASDTAEAIKLLRAAKPGSPVNFAYGMASAAKDSVLLVDRNKAANALLPTAKKAGKACSGKAWLQDGEIVFETDDAPTGLQRSLADWFRLNKVTQKPVVTEPGALQASPEAETEEEDEGPALFTGATILRRLRQSMRGPMNFAFGVGRGDEKNLLALHPRREGARLGAVIRRENSAIRGSAGRVELKGAIAEFHCDRNPIPQLRKLLRALFKSNDIRFRAKVFGPEGEVIEPGDAEDDAADAAAEAAAAPVDAAAEVAQLRTRLTALVERLKPIVAGDATRGAETRTVYAAADAALKAGRPADARPAIERLETIAVEGEDALAEVAEFRAEMQRLLPALRELAPLPEGSEVRPTWQAAEEALKVADLGRAGPAMVTLRTLAGLGAQARRMAVLRTEWPKARAAWQDAIETVDAQISRLQQVLRGSGDEDLEAIAEFGLNAVTNNLKTPLMAALMEIGTGAPTAEGLARGGPRALAAVRAFREHIDSDDRVAACDESPESPTTIRATLGPALAGLEAALAA